MSLPLAKMHLELALKYLKEADREFTLDYQINLCENALMACNLAKIAAQSGKIKRQKPKPKLEIVV